MPLGVVDPESLRYTADGHLQTISTTPERVGAGIAELLSGIALPPPFAAGTYATVLPYEPHLEAASLTLPAVAWEVEHTTVSSHRAKETKIAEEAVASGTLVSIYQQDFYHTLTFHCYAVTSAEAGELLWWLIDSLYRYRQEIATLGSQHLRFLEARKELVKRIGNEQYAARAVSFTCSTALTFRVPMVRLSTITLTQYPVTSAAYEDEVIVRGVDQLSHPRLARVDAVQTVDGTRVYTPEIDVYTGQVHWSHDQSSPAPGAAYRVCYWWYTASPVGAILAAPPA